MTARDIGMVALGYGKYVRAADIVALIPIDDDDRGHGRRTYVHVAGLDAPIVASRSAGAILADMERAAGVPSAHRTTARDEAVAETVDGRLRGARRWRRRGTTAAAA